MLTWTALVIATIAAPQPVSFKADVAPILVSKCLGCHNDRKAANGLNMKTFALLKQGGKTGGDETLVPGDPDASYLIEVIRPDASPRMPLKQPPLSDPQIATLERWVKEGARFDGDSESVTSIATLVDPLSDLPKVAVTVPTSDPIASVAFSADGGTIAAGSGKAVILFDARTGKQTATLGDHAGPVTSVALSASGSTLIAAGGRAGQFGFVTIWDLATRTRRHDLRGHTDAILAASLSPDGRWLATASYDRMVKLWDVGQGRELRTLKEHTDAVHAVAFSPDGTRVASGGADRTVKVWDAPTGKRLVSFSESTGEVYAVAFELTGKTLYAGGVDRSIRAWDLNGQGGSLLKSVFAHDAAVLRLVVAPGGTSIVSTGEDKAVKSWELPSLKPLNRLGNQPDWPQAISIHPDGTKLAVGRYDGSLALLDASTGKSLLSLRNAPQSVPPTPKTKPQLARNATLNPPSPRGGLKGTTLRVALSGVGVGQAVGVSFDDPGLGATIVPLPKPDPNRLDIDLTIAKSVAAGPHQFTVQGPLGVPLAKPFVVFEHPETSEVEPNDDPAKVKPQALPATLVGTIERPGDVDAWRFETKTGQKLVFETVAKSVGSTLDAILTLLDESGHPIASASAGPTTPDPVLVVTAPKDDVLTLVVTDAQFGGDGNHFYRINAGRLPHVTSVFPLGMRRGETSKFELRGVNIAPDLELRSTEPAGSLVPVSPGSSARVVVTEGLQAVEAQDSAPPRAIAMPGAASGRIDRDGDIDLYKFDAKKSRRVIVEVYGRRLGSPIDPVLEILDAQGKAIPRAVLRPVEETNIAFRDHPSTIRAVRLLKWDDLVIGDHLLVGRELMRLAALPRNPDDDAIFWGLGTERTDPGERIAFLETTPEQHPLGQPMTKVEIHPPGAKFPDGGIAPVVLHYQNDDGGPGFGKDSRVTFDPPADGSYLIRVEDVRGLGGPEFGYHLVVRSPHPDFTMSLSTDDPNIPRGGATIIRVDLIRQDGFDSAVDVVVEGLPPGVTATSARIEPEAFTADLLLMADESAPAFAPPSWRVVARSVADSPGDAIIRHDLDPGGRFGGRITVTPPADFQITATPASVRIQPGERVEVTLAVKRGPAFAGRVPIDVRNLPLGVRVLNIGLNGVLVTEQQTSRSIFLYAEPWVKTVERPFYAVGRIEAAAMSSSSSPIALIVEPSSTGRPPRVPR